MLAVRVIDIATLYECGGGTQFFLYQTSLAGTNQAPTLNWSVDNIEAVVADLTDRGITFEHYDLPQMRFENDIHTSTNGEVRNAWFKDPDGNVLSVLQV